MCGEGGGGGVGEGAGRCRQTGSIEEGGRGLGMWRPTVAVMNLRCLCDIQGKQAGVHPIRTLWEDSGSRVIGI